MKNTQKGSIILLVGIIIVSVFAGVIYLYFKNESNSSTSLTIQNQQEVVQDKQNTTPITTSITGLCGLVISSPLVNEKVIWPLIINGNVNQQKTSNDCFWQTFEGVSGTVMLYFNENNKGWRQLGNSVVFGPNFTITFNYTEAGLPTNTPIKAVFTEENPAVKRPSLVFELPLTLK